MYRANINAKTRERRKSRIEAAKLPNATKEDKEWLEKKRMQTRERMRNLRIKKKTQGDHYTKI